MRQNWTIQRIEQLKAAGKIRDYKAPIRKPAAGGRKVGKCFPKRSKEKDWIGWNLLAWCSERGLVYEEEYRFDTVKKYRADYAIPALKILIEYEGLFSEKSGHTTAKGYTKDTNKYNLAAANGWTVLRFTALNYKELITELNKHV